MSPSRMKNAGEVMTKQIKNPVNFKKKIGTQFQRITLILVVF